MKRKRKKRQKFSFGNLLEKRNKLRLLLFTRVWIYLYFVTSQHVHNTETSFSLCLPSQLITFWCTFICETHKNICRFKLGSDKKGADSHENKSSASFLCRRNINFWRRSLPLTLWFSYVYTQRDLLNTAKKGGEEVVEEIFS